MIGPRRITLVVCDGCDALRTKSVSATSRAHLARCAEAGDRLISGARQVYDAPPAWCPFKASAPTDAAPAGSAVA